MRPWAWGVLFWVMAGAAAAQLTDPLGNPLFFGRGTPIYDLNATYELLGGGSSIHRNELFREKTGGLNYFTFNSDRPSVRHQISVGNFLTKFSSFTLNRELFDAARWTVTVPKAQGSSTIFLGRLTNNTFTPSGSPIENRTISSTGDWFMTGLRVEANLGSWTFNLGRFGEATAPLPQIGVSFAKRFFTNYDLSDAANPFQGVVQGPPPDRIVLRFKDDSPEDGGGALIYRARVWIDGQLRYDIAGGKEPPGILMDEQNASRVAVDRTSRRIGRAADGTAVFSYVFPLLNPQDIQSVEIAVEAANDYRIELLTPPEYPSAEPLFERRAQAEGNVKDGSNRTTERFFFGSLTDESTLGIDLQTSLLGFSIEAERAWHNRVYQYPLYNAERSGVGRGAWFVDMNRRFGPVFWRGEYTHIDPFYTAVNFVDDNDNDDPYRDAREATVPFAGSDKDDRDRDGVKDWDDDFLMFFADPPSFVLGLSRESIDFNNNGTPDNLEDDRLPNYRLDYDEGTNGFHTYAVMNAPALEGLRVIPGYYEKNALLNGTNARGFYNILSYEPKRIRDFGTVRARHTLRRSKDQIPDNFIQRGREVVDDLRLSDYLGHILTFIVNYDQIKNLTIAAKFKYENNTLYNLRENSIDTQLIYQLRYVYEAPNGMTLSPAFRSDRSIGYREPYQRVAEIDSLRNVFILTFAHKVADELLLSAGLQYLTWRDYTEARNDYNRRVGFLELVLKGSAFGQQLGLIGAIDYSTQSYLRPVGGDSRQTQISVSLFLL